MGQSPLHTSMRRSGKRGLLLRAYGSDGAGAGREVVDRFAPGMAAIGPARDGLVCLGVERGALFVGCFVAKGSLDLLGDHHDATLIFIETMIRFQRLGITIDG